MNLAEVVVAVLSQTLLPRAEGKGRIVAFEIMLGNSAVKNLIREGKTFELHSVMQLSVSEDMQTLDQALADLVKKKIVTLEETKMKSSHPDRLKKLLEYQYTSAKH